MSDLSGKVAVITGAGSGIGAAVAAYLHRLNARVHLLARSVAIPPLAPAKPPIRVTASPPAHMIEALRICGWRDSATPAETP